MNALIVRELRRVHTLDQLIQFLKRVPHPERVVIGIDGGQMEARILHDKEEPDERYFVLEEGE